MSSQNAPCATRVEPPRIAGLDSIRGLCALVVVFGHLGAPPLTHYLVTESWVDRVGRGLYSSLWNGPAAVIVFFVISGFCIHYPHTTSLRIPSIAAYSLRRYVRIGLPLLVAVALASLWDVNLSLLNLSILWSLIAELIYYTLYPMLLCIRRQTGSWAYLIIASMAFAFALASTQPAAGGYPVFGIKWNWLLGLPCWLLGCFLADSISSRRASRMVDQRTLWAWRLTILTASALAYLLRFHSPVGYPWTLNIFAVSVMFWLQREIVWFSFHRPPSVLEWFGTWSYSLYLCHELAAPLVRAHPLTNYGVAFNWLMLMGFVMSFSYFFFLLIESPSHRLAKAIAGIYSLKRSHSVGS